MCTHRNIVYPHAYTLSSHFHSTSIIWGCDNVTYDPCESPWTQRSWPVKPVNVFHMFLHMSGSAPYARARFSPPWHSSLSHTIFWISNSDSMTYNSSTSFFTSLVISSTVEASWRPGSCLWHLSLSHPDPQDTRQLDDHRQFSGVFEWEQSWVTTLRSYGFAFDKFALDRLSWHWGNESCAVYKDPSICASFFSSATRPGLCQNIPICSLSNVLDSCPVRGFKLLSRQKETDRSSICPDKRWETIGLTVKDRKPSRVSVTLFSNDVLELGQHWEKIVASCVACRWPTLELF